MIQRAIALGAESVSPTRQLTAGQFQDATIGDWNDLAATEAIATEDRAFYVGAYQYNDQWISVNRPQQEDDVRTLDEAAVAQLFQGLDVQVVEDEIGSQRELASEIWHTFLWMMLLALIAEALLCLPSPPPPEAPA